MEEEVNKGNMRNGIFVKRKKGKKEKKAKKKKKKRLEFIPKIHLNEQQS